VAIIRRFYRARPRTAGGYLGRLFGQYEVGRDLGDVSGAGRSLRVQVTDDISRTIKTRRPDIAVLCTRSALKQAMPEFEAVLNLKVPIVSTTEELAYPVKRNAAAARKIDALAKRARVAVLGTGINPGFIMDALPIALTGVCESVRAIEIDRIQDARIRRPTIPREDRRRTHARRVHEEGEGGQRPACRLS
jgi:4-hydroxy-tetrahydrodipicolinate reductase